MLVSEIPRIFTDDRWNECATSYLRSVYDRSGSKASLKTYSDELRTFFRDLDPLVVSRADIIRRMQAPSQSRRSKGQPPTGATQNHRLALLRSFYTWASAWVPAGETEPLFNRASPCAGIKRCKENIVYRSLSTDELRSFFAAIDEEAYEAVTAARNHALFTTLFLTALRRGSLLGIRWGDISETIFRENGEARPGWTVKYFSKGKSRVQSVRELPPAAMAAIMRYLEVSGRLTTIADDSYIFAPVHAGHQGIANPEVDHNKALSACYINHIAKNIARIANLDERRVSCHVFRHSSASERIKAGQTLEEICRALDHSDISVTARYCMHLQGQADNGARMLESRLPWLHRPMVSTP